MKIVHLAPSCVYTEGWGYQENLLPKYQARLGHEVYLIVPTRAFCGTEIQETGEERYLSPDGFFVIRKRLLSLPCKLGLALRYFAVYEELLRLEPDMIFYISNFYKTKNIGGYSFIYAAVIFLPYLGTVPKELRNKKGGRGIKFDNRKNPHTHI